MFGPLFNLREYQKSTNGSDISETEAHLAACNAQLDKVGVVNRNLGVDLLCVADKAVRYISRVDRHIHEL